MLGQALDLLRDGKPARLTDPKDADEERILRQAQLLTSKPVLYVCNVEEANAATGNSPNANNPPTISAIDISSVATGRRMQNSETFILPPPSWRSVRDRHDA